MSAKWVIFIIFSLTVAGLSGFGITELIPNNSNSEENLADISTAGNSVGKVDANSDVGKEAKYEAALVLYDDGIPATTFDEPLPEIPTTFDEPLPEILIVLDESLLEILDTLDELGYASSTDGDVYGNSTGALNESLLEFLDTLNELNNVNSINSNDTHDDSKD